MKLTNKILLPGTDKQISAFLDSVNAENKSMLVAGAGSEEIAKIFHQKNAGEVYLIIDDEDSLVQARFALSKIKEINIRLMEYDNTDFKADKFDIIYSQGSTGTKKRNRIIKEIKRILKPGGFFCIGEIVSMTKEVPAFVTNIWNNSNLTPLYKDEIKKYYTSQNFDLIFEQDLSETLKDFYSMSKILLQESSKEFSDEEVKSFKKMLKTYSHEANAYLKLGGDKYMGYRMLVLKKVQV